jgi:uncharacterized protein YecT (DUF1311 family)
MIEKRSRDSYYHFGAVLKCLYILNVLDGITAVIDYRPDQTDLLVNPTNVFLTADGACRKSLVWTGGGVYPKSDTYGFKDQAMNSLLASIITGTILSMSPLFISASEAATESPGFQKCMDDVDLSAFKNSQWAACYEAELQIQDRRLNVVYQRVQRANTPELKQALLKGQRAWLIFRDAWCSYEEQTPYAPGGSVNKLACLMDITIDQIERLEPSEGI